jgi:acetyl-CoA decarbonylase/synthase complex subunit delta
LDDKREKERGHSELDSLLDVLGLDGEREIELEEVEIKAKPTSILEAPFTPFRQEYPGQIREVTLGATKSEGGSRGKKVVIGGATTPAFYHFEKTPPHPPIISVDTFDMKVRLPKAIRMHVEEVWEDTAAWAKRAVKKWGADVLTVHLLSTDPLIKDTSPAEAAKTIEEVLQAVDVPLIVGGCGDPKKDAEVFTKVAEVAEGERVLLSSLTLDMDEAGVLEGVAKAAGKHGQLVLAFTALDLNRAKELNRKLYEYVSPANILMDLTTAALGYGLEFAFTIHERARLEALMGEKELQHPVLAGTTNAWAAREAWMKLGPEWEPRSLRGPLWETLTAVTLLLAGVDVFMMMHPEAVKHLRKVVQQLMTRDNAKLDNIASWVMQKYGGR